MMLTLINQEIAIAVYHISSANTWTQTLAILFSDGLLLLAFMCYVFVLWPIRRAGAYKRTLFHDLLPIAATAAIALTSKYFIHAERPYVVLHFVPFVPATDPLASFPSMHVALIATFAVTLWFTHPRLGRVIACMVPLVMLGRIAVGVHWFTDVIAGAMLGTAVAYIFHWFDLRKK